MVHFLVTSREEQANKKNVENSCCLYSVTPRMKVSIEKYYKEIGSLSSCFSNGFKWLYLSLRRKKRRRKALCSSGIRCKSEESRKKTNSSKLNILTRFLFLPPINNSIKMLITIHSDPIELRYYDSFNMLSAFSIAFIFLNFIGEVYVWVWVKRRAEE